MCIIKRGVLQAEYAQPEILPSSQSRFLVKLENYNNECSFKSLS